jgi:hypothetical protein
MGGLPLVNSPSIKGTNIMAEQHVLFRSITTGARIAFNYLDGPGKFNVKFSGGTAIVKELKKIAAIKKDKRFGVTFFEVEKAKEKEVETATKETAVFEALKDSIARAQSAKALKGVEKLFAKAQVTEAHRAELAAALEERKKDLTLGKP